MQAVVFDASHAASYTEDTPRKVPGFADLHKMTLMLLSEHVSSHGRLLILGAGGGLELKAFAEARPEWTFEAVDPSADMLQLAKQVIGENTSRVTFREGYIDSASTDLFDAATCFLTFHFIPREMRLETLRQIRRRLKTGAPFVIAHISFTQTEPERSKWISRHIAYSFPSAANPTQMEASRQAIATKLTILAPEEEEELLREAGFGNVSLFYAGFSFKGWVAYAV